jgi:hypothetical protein
MSCGDSARKSLCGVLRFVACVQCLYIVIMEDDFSDSEEELSDIDDVGVDSGGSCERKNKRVCV